MKGVFYMQEAKINRSRIFPAFPDGQEILDAVESKDCSSEELSALASIQGAVNKNGVRIAIFDSHTDEGAFTWADTLGLRYTLTDKYDIFRKYLPLSGGVVLYDTEKSRHYLNLAFCAGATYGCAVMSRRLFERLGEMGISAEINEDLSTLPFVTPEEIYGYAYEKYWPRCNHRLLISQNPNEAFHIRDMAIAGGCAVIFTENRDENQRRIYEKFLDDMEPGASVVTGWYTEERSGITTATSRGLSTVPSDLFSNMTVFSRSKEIIKREPAAPREVGNGIYAALFISDGDNIQYCQRYLRKLWDASAADRGSVALNWTISPALTEAAPDIMNYYYSTATQKDCFVSGPSGFGYAMPVNTLAEEIPAGNYVKDDSAFAEYAAMSGYYCGLAGLPAVTVWDNMTAEQRHLYAVNAPELLGITVQLFTDNEEKISSTETGGMPVKQLTPCYCTEISHLERVLERKIEAEKKDAPLFIACQISVWGKITISQIAGLEKRLCEKYGAFEFVRADEFFSMMRKASRI